MTNWTNPTLLSLYTDVLADLKARDVEAATFFSVAGATNLPTGTMRFVRASAAFEEWSGAAWVVKPIGLAGGGTSGVDAATARAGLGLTSLAVMDPNNVVIKGTIEIKAGGITFDSDGTRDIGTNTVRPNRIYVRNALVIPVGVNKYATS